MYCTILSFAKEIRDIEDSSYPSLHQKYHIFVQKWGSACFGREVPAQNIFRSQTFSGCNMYHLMNGMRVAKSIHLE